MAEIATCGAEGAIGTEGRPLSEVAEARRRTAPCGRAGRRGLRLERLRAAFMRHDRGGGRGALALHAERAAGEGGEHIAREAEHGEDKGRSEEHTSDSSH